MKKIVLFLVVASGLSAQAGGMFTTQAVDNAKERVDAVSNDDDKHSASFEAEVDFSQVERARSISKKGWDEKRSAPLRGLIEIDLTDLQGLVSDIPNVKLAIQDSLAALQNGALHARELDEMIQKVGASLKTSMSDIRKKGDALTNYIVGCAEKIERRASCLREMIGECEIIESDELRHRGMHSFNAGRRNSCPPDLNLPSRQVMEGMRKAQSSAAKSVKHSTAKEIKEEIN